MAMIDLTKVADEALTSFDVMMCDCALMVEPVSKLADAFWGEVLTELSVRGKIRILSGSCAAPGDALIIRDYF